MGGFEGGDEGGFWDIDSISTLIDKQNNNKSENKRREKPYIETNDSGYSIKAHSKVDKELYDTISFVPYRCETFTIEGCDDIPLETNSIYKAYRAMIDFTCDLDIEEFFYEHKVVVTKRISSGAGLGGAYSDAAAFMHLLKEVCNLILSRDELVKIGRTISDKVPFYL